MRGGERERGKEMRRLIRKKEEKRRDGACAGILPSTSY